MGSSIWRLLGDELVTSVDRESYDVEAAITRLNERGMAELVCPAITFNVVTGDRVAHEFQAARRC
jgi:hypothetical protein